MPRRRGPEITVYIPVYNCEKFIGAAIESTLNQTFEDFELIILDDNSTDNTMEVIGRFKDKRIRLIKSRVSVGAAANWNKGLKESRGRFIKVLCHDDVIYPRCLELQREILVDPEYGTTALVCSTRDIIDEQGEKVLKRKFAKKDFRMKGVEAIKKTIRSGTNLLGETSSSLFPAAVVKETGPFDDCYPYVIDLEMWSRILLHGDLYCFGEPLAAFRVSSGSWSMELQKRQGLDYRRFIDHLAANPAYSLSGLDIRRGKFMSHVQFALRQIFYRVFLR